MARRRILRVFLYVILGIGTLIFVGPFLASLSLSFQPAGNVFSWPMQLIPDHPTLENYVALWTTVPFPRWLLNSVIIALIVTVSNLFFDTLAGYAFARMRFPGKQVIFGAFLATLMVPGHVTLIPSFMILNALGLINTYTGMFLPKLTQVFGIFLMKQFFETVPRELEEAAAIDGCSRFMTLWKILVPVSTPAIVALAIYTFQGNWNEFMWPLIVTTTRDLFTLPVGMAYFRHEFQVDWTILMAGVVLMALPTLFIFIVFQRFFVQGVTSTGLKA